MHRVRLAAALCLLVACAWPAQARKFPNGPDGEPPKNAMSGVYRAAERTPVYRTPVAGGRPLFFLPRNSRVQIEGKFNGWGVFSTYMPERFKTLLQEAVPGLDTQYAWVRMDGLRNTETPGRGCPDIAPRSSEDDYFACGGEYENVSDKDIVVFLKGYRHTGRTFRKVENTGLNLCVRTCRDEAKCTGFFYSADSGACELKDSGGVDFEKVEIQEAPKPYFSGAKLVD